LIITQQRCDQANNTLVIFLFPFLNFFSQKRNTQTSLRRYVRGAKMKAVGHLSPSLLVIASRSASQKCQIQRKMFIYFSFFMHTLGYRLNEKKGFYTNQFTITKYIQVFFTFRRRYTPHSSKDPFHIYQTKPHSRFFLFFEKTFCFYILKIYI